MSIASCCRLALNSPHEWRLIKDTNQNTRETNSWIWQKSKRSNRFLSSMTEWKNNPSDVASRSMAYHIIGGRVLSDVCNLVVCTCCDCECSVCAHRGRDMIISPFHFISIIAIAFLSFYLCWHRIVKHFLKDEILDLHKPFYMISKHFKISGKTLQPNQPSQVYFVGNSTGRQHGLS